MRKTLFLAAVALLLQATLPGPSSRAFAQHTENPYAAMAPLSQYLIPSQSDEIALARSAAPPSIAGHATVMVLGPHGYTTPVHGSNGFLCIVERSWATQTSFSEFWNPHIRAPNCFNAAATRTFADIYLFKTRLVLAGKSPAQILRATRAAFASGQLPPLAPGSMCYMMSPRQFLNDQGKSWHPHLMFFAPGNVAPSWGANLPGSPLIAAKDSEEHVTIFMVLVKKWSDGSPAPQ